MRRLLITGPPCAGKSTIALSLGAKLDVPVTHLDWSWGSGPPGPSLAEFERNVAVALAEPEWILDGAIPKAADINLGTGYVVVLVDLPLRVRLPRLIRRRGRVDLQQSADVHRSRVGYWLLLLAGVAHPLSWRRHHRKRADQLARRGALLVLGSIEEIDSFRSNVESVLASYDEGA